MDTLKEKKIGDYLIRVVPDEYNDDNPNDWCDDNFLLSEQPSFSVTKDGFDPVEINDNGEKLTGYHVFRCFAYIHGGVALSVQSHNFPDARWDVSFVGYWVIKRQKGNWTKKQALKTAKNLCDTWNNILSGSACGFKIYELDNNIETKIESVWGFYDVDECMSEAESFVSSFIESNT